MSRICTLYHFNVKTRKKPFKDTRCLSLLLATVNILLLPLDFPPTYVYIICSVIACYHGGLARVVCYMIEDWISIM